MPKIRDFNPYLLEALKDDEGAYFFLEAAFQSGDESVIKRALEKVFHIHKEYKGKYREFPPLEDHIELPYVGEMLVEEFLEPLKISQNALAKAIAVPPNRISGIVKNKRKITADTDLRLCRFFGLSDGFWLRCQGACDLMEARRRLGAQLDDIKPYVYEDDHH